MGTNAGFATISNIGAEARHGSKPARLVEHRKNPGRAEFFALPMMGFVSPLRIGYRLLAIR
jgi:hypothetical protein